MKDALVSELADLWETQAAMTEGLTQCRREALRECADMLRMLMQTSASATTEKTPREQDMEELLRSACCIADRRGEETAWSLFAASIRTLGLNGVTARTYRAQRQDGSSMPPSRTAPGIDDA